MMTTDRSEHVSSPLRRTGLLLSLFLGSAPLAAAQQPFDAQLRAAEALLRASEIEAAAEAFALAAALNPDSARAAFGLGAARYRLRDWSGAREAFSAAAERGDADLAAAATFNLGNSAYAEALELVDRLQSPRAGDATTEAAPSSTEQRDPMAEVKTRLEEAIRHFRDAAVAAPADRDARANAQRARRLLKEIEQQEQEQEQEQEQQQEQQEQQEKQDEQEQQDQQQKQDQQDQQQKQEKQEQQEQQEKRDQQQKQDQQGQQDQQQKQDRQEPQDQQDQQQTPEQQQGRDQQQDPQQEPQQEQPPSGDPSATSDQQKGTPVQVHEAPLTKDEVQRLLQAVRDREKARRAKLDAQRQRRPVPTAKDW
jgi:hypothetical protein